MVAHVYQCRNGHEHLSDGDPERAPVLVHQCEDCGELAQRVCGCPCREPLTGLSAQCKYKDSRHRQRAYRVKLRTRREAAHLPSPDSIRALEAYGGTSERNGDAEKPARARPRARRTGVSVYFPTEEACEFVRRLIANVYTMSGSEELWRKDAEDAIDKALARRKRQREEAAA